MSKIEFHNPAFLRIPDSGFRCFPGAAAAALAVLVAAGCSVRRMAADALGDALAEGGDVFASDDDPDLVREALPFGLKTYESLLAESPEHRGLLQAAAAGFIQYARAFVQEDADRRDDTDAAGARALRARARRLHLRGRDYALRGLEASHPGFRERFAAARDAALAETAAEDAPLLYWAGAGWAAALTADKGDLGLVADLPAAAALVARSLALDEAWGGGAAHEFFAAYEGARSEAMGGSADRARAHYRRALELSGGRRASVHLALAETVALRTQDLAEFRRLLDAALAIDPDAVPSARLGNTLARRRAEWLKTRVPDLFVDAEP